MQNDGDNNSEELTNISDNATKEELRALKEKFEKQEKRFATLRG